MGYLHGFNSARIAFIRAALVQIDISAAPCRVARRTFHKNETRMYSVRGGVGVVYISNK